MVVASNILVVPPHDTSHLASQELGESGVHTVLRFLMVYGVGFATAVADGVE